MRRLNRTEYNHTVRDLLLVDGARTSEAKTLIRVKNARIGFAQTLPLFFPETVYAPGIHPTAVVSSRASVDATAHIGPHCVVADGCTIAGDLPPNSRATRLMD